MQTICNPNTTLTHYGMLVNGTDSEVQAALAGWGEQRKDLLARFAEADKRATQITINPAGESYQFSQERMAATMLTNVVYPIRTRGTYIRHYTPGRKWDCLYTWDSGFVGLGLAELDLERSLDNLNAYLTEPGSKDAESFDALNGKGHFCPSCIGTSSVFMMLFEQYQKAATKERRNR